MTRLYKFGWLLLMGMIASHGHIVSSEEISDTANEDKDELVFAQVVCVLIFAYHRQFRLLIENQ